MIDSFISLVINVFLWILPVPALFLLGWATWKFWLHYIQQNFISGITWTVLEIVPPRDVLRSPQSMELFLTNGLYHWSMKGGLEQYWQGAVWFWFSLEIVSIEGQVHFYIRTPSRVKDLIETQMYAQYPQAQVKVVDDYTAAVDEITPKSKWNLWGCEFKLERPEAYPIRTYTSYGLDKDPKEEYKIDPISPVIEFFGSAQKGEQMWLQIVVRPTKKRFRDHGKWFKYHDWVVESQMELDRVLEPYMSQKLALHDKVATEVRAPNFLNPIVEGITEKMHKIGFDTGIRVCYVATKEVFPYGTRTNNSRNIRLIFRQYANPFMNSFARHNSTQADAYSGYFPASKRTVMRLANRHLHAYREREFFHLPMRHRIFNQHNFFWPFDLLFKPYLHPVYFVLNVEELATIWHFPGQILKVPTLERIESKEAAPPTNLPI